MKRTLFYGLLLSGVACKSTNYTTPVTVPIAFSPPVQVAVNGYTGNLMEPFLTRDGNVLLFNNLNSPTENTNLHWATRLTDSTFQYQGELTGVNTPDLEGVPTLDQAGNLYFVSTRNYVTTLSTLYQGSFANGAVMNLRLIPGVSRQQAGIVNFDVEVSADGQRLYFVDAQFDQSGTPQTADLVIARKTSTGFERLPNSATLLQNLNTEALEYAAGISANELELYFTRVATPLTATSVPVVMVATRPGPAAAFGQPMAVASITGFAEAPTVAPDQKTIYFHRKDNGVFGLYLTRKK